MSSRAKSGDLVVKLEVKATGLKARPRPLRGLRYDFGFARNDSTSRSRVRLRVSFFQAFDGDVRVNLRGRKTGVAEQCLHAAKVSAVIEQMRSKAMAKFVRTERNWNRGVAQVTF